MLTIEDQELNRLERLAEKGAEPACPFCRRPRVLRSDYIRCNVCGVNWAAGEMHLPNYLNMDPRVARTKSALTGSSTRPTAGRPGESAE